MLIIIIIILFGHFHSFHPSINQQVFRSFLFLFVVKNVSDATKQTFNYYYSIVAGLFRIIIIIIADIKSMNESMNISNKFFFHLYWHHLNDDDEDEANKQTHTLHTNNIIYKQINARCAN